MELYEDAVSLALGIDIELAKRVANKPRDPETKKNLWLTIVKHLVEGKNNVKGYELFYFCTCVCSHLLVLWRLCSSAHCLPSKT